MRAFILSSFVLFALLVAHPAAAQDATLGCSVVDITVVQSIPLNIRNPLQMINNAVGVTPGSADSGNNNVSQSRTNTFRINGAKASTTDIQLDGAANITAYANQAASVPQVDAVE